MITLSFTPAAQLKKSFYTEGAFYKLEVDGASYKCRGLARIVLKNRDVDKADALIVMMNPGSCRPIDESYEYPLMDDLFSVPMVRAVKDPTQYQLMRLMEEMEWNLIYMINLSDLASGNSDEFLSYKQIMDAAGRSDHSIFSEKRIQSLNAILAGSSRHIVAWGKNEGIQKEAAHALAVLIEMTNVEGLSCGYPFYRHPFPMLKSRCIEWLDDMGGELEGSKV